MLLTIHPDNPNPRELAQAVGILRDGGIVIYPTDTIYAIGCNALDVRAVEHICMLKGVDLKKSRLSVVFSGFSGLSEYVNMSNDAFKLMKANLPGPFTFILPAGTSLPKIYRNRKEVGIRIPDNRIARALVDGLGSPVLSMTLKGKSDEGEESEYFTEPTLIHEKFGSLVDLVIDGGEGGLEPSTVVDCTGREFSVVREGKGILE